LKIYIRNKIYEITRMKEVKEKSVAVISMARNDAMFVQKWIHYYGSQFGYENLFLILDGHDQSIPAHSEKINIIRVPHITLSRSNGDKNRSQFVSKIAQSLFLRFDRVLAMDIDEFLVIDPKLNISLKEYLSQKSNVSSVSALGLDVGQYRKEEGSINLNQPFLEQRNYAHVSSRYTKPIVAYKPITWGTGFHRVKWKNFRIDPNLFLFHFGMVDYEVATEKTNNESRLNEGWSMHLKRRKKLFSLIENSSPVNGDEIFAKARRDQTFLRPLYAPNKPGIVLGKTIVKIPKRFQRIV